MTGCLRSARSDRDSHPRRIGRSLMAAGATALFVGTLLTACSEDAAAEDVVTLMTHDSFSLPDSVLETFRQETGLTLRIIPSGDAGQLASTVSLTPGSPQADAVFGIDNTFASRPIDAGALVPYTSPAAADGAEEFAIPETNNELTAVDRGDVCLNIDDAWYARNEQEPPTGFRDLTNPVYAEQTVLMDPATSSPGMAFLLTTIGALGEGWRDYWRQVIDGGATIVSGWETAYNQEFTAGEGQGDNPIVLSYASSPAATQGTRALLNSCFRQVEYIGILAGAANEDGARQLVDFMLSPTVQVELPASMYVYPVQRDTPLPDGWQQRAPVPGWTVSLPPEYIAENRENWQAQWRDAVGR